MYNFLNDSYSESITAYTAHLIRLASMTCFISEAVPTNIIKYRIVELHIMELVSNSLGGGHTHNIHTDFLEKAIL